MSSDEPFDGESTPEPRSHVRRDSSAVPLGQTPPRRNPQAPRSTRPGAPIGSNGQQGQHGRQGQQSQQGQQGLPPSFPVKGNAAAGPNSRQPNTRQPSTPEIAPTRIMPTTGAPRQAAPPTHQAAPGQRPAPGQRQSPSPQQKGSGRRRSRKPRAILALILAILIAWPIGLGVWGSGKIQHVEALSGASDTAGRTYLLAGSDSRDDGYFSGDPTEGHRADTIMLLTIPASGNSSLISLPRDTYVEIPGYNPNKLNAAFSFGGPQLLVQTVEQLTGQTIDHYVEIGMGGVAGIVDAVGGVELCLDYDVSDKDSQLEWTAGCHMADGATALAFARMRKSDPMGDIGRNQRQQQVIKAVTATAVSPSLLNPFEQVRLAEAGFAAFVTDSETGAFDLARLVWAFRELSADDAVRGAPPIADMNYRPGGVGSAVRLADSYPEFFAAVADGSVTTEMLNP